MSTPTSRRLAFAASAVALAVLAGCATPGESTQRAELATPQSLGAADGQADWPAADWWHAYGDAELGRLIDRALEQAPTVRIAEARLAQATAQAQAAGGALLPSLQVAASSTRERLSENYIYPAGLGGSTVNDNVLRLGGSWNLDLFGRDRAALDAAIGARRAADADRAAARWVLSTQIARSWYQIARLVDLREVSASTLKQREQIRELVADRVNVGLDTKVELRQAEGSVPQIRQDIEAIDEQIELARNGLAALVGVPPQSLAEVAPRLPAKVSAQLPSVIPADLIGRRPDVVGARLRAESALRSIDEARAMFYPNINLTAFIGFHSIGLDRWVEAGSRETGLTPAISLPLFDGGRLRANLRAHEAGADAAIETYNQTLLLAVRDVADAVASTRSVQRQIAEQQQAQAAAESAYDLAVTRYQAGLGTYLTVLSAESNVLTQHRQAAELKARTLDLQIALTRALGGGYRQPVEASANQHAAASAASKAE
ncbi:MAG: efflux transporter outer membrane subunit [Aquabacterium sp.]|nr:MAG: efflux transporter outer membrane subunit [Aquabacterium sp.]